jgi:Ca2+-binding RTX toxin-like protein
MATLIVTNLNDSGAGSLRAAIATANASVGVADVIKFADDLAGTITLTSGQLALTDDVTIIGDNTDDHKADITISGGNTTRIFNQTGAGTDVVLKSLTLTNGNAGVGAGGAIYANSGTLNIQDSTIQNSSANRGGGITSNVGTIVTLTNSLLSGNSAADGGGLYTTGGSTTLINSTVTGNSASNLGGGLYTDIGNTMTLLNSTVAGNTAVQGGSGIMHFGSAGALTITNSVVAGTIAGIVATADHSVFETAPTITTNTLSLTNQSLVNIGLGTLGNHGGTTDTINIISGTSVLIDAGNNGLAPAGTDANGVTRIDGPRVDVGATEHVHTLVVTNLNASGAGSLLEAVTLANANGDTSHIVFQNGLTGNIALANTLNLYSNVTINGDTDGNGDANITLTDGGAGGALVNIYSGSTVGLTSLNIANSTVAFGASAISNAGNLTLGYSVISGNTVVGLGTNGIAGAAIFNGLGATLNLTQDLLLNNTQAGQNGQAGSSGIGAGGNGGNGGNAATIVNLGILVLSGDAIVGGSVNGGNGGNGGNGSFGFNGGNGGNAGNVATGILNLGTVSGSEVTSGGLSAITHNPGLGGSGGGGGGVNGSNGSFGSNSFYNSNVSGGSGSISAIVTGTSGADTHVFGNFSTYYGLGGADNITAGFFSHLYGGAGNDILTSLDDSKLYGGLGNDILRNSFLNPNYAGTWDGGAGIDTFDGSASTSSNGLYLNLYNGGNNFGGTIISIENIIGTNNAALGDTLVGSNGVNTIQGMAGTDVILGLAGADILDGGAGDDLLEGGRGADQLIGGIGIDTATYIDAEYGVAVNLGNGALNYGDAIGDTFNGIEIIEGSQFGDTLTGDGANNIFRGLDGGDVINGAGGSDTADYSDKTLAVSVGLNGAVNAVVSVGGVSEDIISNIENIIGGSGADLITGDGLANTLTGGAGDDYIDGAAGGDTLDGGANTAVGDTLTYATSSAAVTVNIGTNTAFGGDAAGDIISNFENLTGSAFQDVLSAGAGSNVLHGGADNDTLNGGTGSDFIFGDAGQDTIVLKNGLAGDFDNINGGSERDLLDMSGITNGAVWIDFGYNVISGPNLATGFNLSTAAGDGRVVQMDSMIGTSFSDTMRGDAGSNFIDGGAGDDQLLSYSPYDTVTPYSSLGDVILGGAGNDLLFSGTGNDYLDGGIGNDTIEVGGGTDTVITGTGNDIVFFSPNCGTDTVTDFTGGAGVVDVLKLYGFGTAFDTAAEVKAAASQHGLDTWIVLPGTTIILQNFTATTLANDDFVLV